MPAIPSTSNPPRVVCMRCTAHDPGPYVVTHFIWAVCPRDYIDAGIRAHIEQVEGRLVREPTYVCRRCTGAWGRGIVTHPANQDCPRKADECATEQDYKDLVGRLKRRNGELKESIRKQYDELTLRNSELQSVKAQLERRDRQLDDCRRASAINHQAAEFRRAKIDAALRALQGE